MTPDRPEPRAHVVAVLRLEVRYDLPELPEEYHPAVSAAWQAAEAAAKRALDSHRALLLTTSYAPMPRRPTRERSTQTTFDPRRP